MDVTIVIASYGDRRWLELAAGRAYESAVAQGVPVIVVHGLTLHDARNAGLDQVVTTFVVHLDADDELAPGYLKMLSRGTADIRVPAVSYVVNGRRRPPHIPKVAGHRRPCVAACLEQGNWIVCGAMVRTELVRSVGRWEPFEWSEDWALWARCYRAGATIEAIPAAIYIAHVRLDSRNRGPSWEAKDAAHWQIHRAVWPERYTVPA